MQARERAEQIAQAACKKENVQILDVTVSLKKIGFRKNKQGQYRFFRYFNFEFSLTGEDRRTGTIAMHGTNEQYIYMDLPEQPVIEIQASRFSNGKYHQNDNPSP